MGVVLNYILPPAEYALNKNVQFEFDSLVGLINTEIATLAPVGATYVTLSTNSTLTNERVLTGTTNQISIADNGAGSTVVLSTPQNIHTAATPTFASETLTATTNQLILGSTRTVTLTAPTPATSSRTITFPDLVGDYSVVGTIAAQTIGGIKTFTSPPSVSISSGTVLTFITSVGSTQQCYMEMNGASGSNNIAISANRTYLNGGTGVSNNTSQAAAQIIIFTSSSNSSISLATTPTNNSNPISRLDINKDGQVSISQTLVVTGQSTLNGTAGNPIHGTNTNDAASAGFIGEYVESIINSAANFPTSNTVGDMTSISLTAGDWDVSLIFSFNNNGGTPTYVYFGISQTTGNSATGLVTGSNRLEIIPETTGNGAGASIPCYRQSLNGTTTIYAKVLGIYTSTAPLYRCRLSARRIR